MTGDLKYRFTSLQKMIQSRDSWKRKYNRLHHIDESTGIDGSKLRFVLGAGRSGTSWVGRTLAETSTPLRYFHEILTYVNPFYYYSGENDLTAVKYSSDPAYYEPLFKIYASSSRPDIYLEKMLPKRSQQVKRNDPQFQYTLHKEVHSLLGTEALVRHFKVPMVFLTRNPAYVIDSLFDYHRLDSIIWRNESLYIQLPEFIEKYMKEERCELLKTIQKFPDDGTVRRNTIIGKAITVGVINRMLHTISSRYDNILYVKYETLCENPIDTFQNIHDFLGFEFQENEINKLKSRLEVKNEDYNPMSIHRDTKNQVNRALKSLTKEEFAEISSVLSDLRLSVDDY